MCHQRVVCECVYFGDYRAYFTQICIKFADAIISRFVASLYRCKPLNTFGAEQLLLDTQCLKSALLQLPLFGTKVCDLLVVLCFMATYGLNIECQFNTPPR